MLAPAAQPALCPLRLFETEFLMRHFSYAITLVLYRVIFNYKITRCSEYS